MDRRGIDCLDERAASEAEEIANAGVDGDGAGLMVMEGGFVKVDFVNVFNKGERWRIVVTTNLPAKVDVPEMCALS